MPTTIESLELEVQSSSASAVKGIDALSASLSKLKSAVKGGVGLTSVTNQLKNLNSTLQSMDSNAAGKIDKLTTSLSKLSSLGKIKLSSSVGNQLRNIGSAAATLNGTDFSGLDRLGTSLRGLNSLTKATGLSSALNQLKKIPEITKALDSKVIADFTARIKQLSDALQPLVAQLNTVGGAFSRLPVQVRRVISSTQALDNANRSATRGYVNLWAKAIVAYNAVRMGARTIASWIHESNSYIENLNLFTASLGEYAGEAQKYAEQVGEIMGIDPGEFMRHQGVFMTITEGFGVASDRAYIMSKNLTQLGYDLSSFFNISFADSMQKLTSGISGELEPLRRLGYDLSEARLKAVALSLGIDKSFNSMTQAEKAQLRYYTIMKQVTVAQGDMARTLNAPANQLRILQAQVTQCARALGNIFIPVLNAVLPYAIALAKVIRLIANSIASLFGFTLPEIDYSGLNKGAGGLADNANDAADGLGNAAKKAKEVKNALLGIDELNIISPLEDATGGGVGDLAGGAGLDFELPEYDFLNGAVASKVEEIVQKMKEWLGLTEEINSWGDFFHTKLGRILTTIGAIGLGLAGWKIATSVISGLEHLKKLKELGLGKAMTLSVGISLAITGIMLETAGIIDAIKNELDGLNFAQIIGGGGFITAGGAVIGKALGSAIIGGGIGAIVAGIPAFITGIYDSIKNGISWLSAALTGIGATAAGAGIGAIIGACGGPIGAGIGALIGLAVGLVTDGIILVVQKWDEITAFLKNFFTVTVPGIWKKFTSWLSSAVSAFKNFDWYGLGHDIGMWLGNAWKNAVDFVTVKIPNYFSNLWSEIKRVCHEFFCVTLPQFFTETLPEAFNNMVEWFKGLPEKIKKAWEAGKKWFVEIGTAIVDGIVEGFQSIWQGIKDFCKGIVDGFKEALGIHSPSKVFAELGEFLAEGLLNGLAKPFKAIKKWIKTHIIDPIKKVIDKSDIGELVMNIKNTASEWWDKTKSWWSEVSKNGISVEAGVSLAKKGWSTVKNWIGKLPTISQTIGLLKKGWSTVKGWIGEIPIIDQAISLVKRGWDTVKNWVGSIPTLDQTIALARSGWETVKGWIGHIPTLDQTIALIKSGWTTVKNWIGNIPTLSQAIALIKNGWYSVKEWIGNIPVLNQAISLIRSGWTTVKNWVGSIPVLSQGISLIKSGWSTVKGWIGWLSDIAQGISLSKSGWYSVSGWIGSLSTLWQKIGLSKYGWSSISSFVGTSVSVGISLWKNGWSSISSFVGRSVSVGVSLFKSGWSSLKRFFGLSSGGYNTGHGFKMFEQGGFLKNGVSEFWKSIPMYANGTANAGMHGSMFVAGENGAEMVGHINGQTEVLNQSQIKLAMRSAVISGMAQFTGYWRMINSQIAVCTNAIIHSVLVSSNLVAAQVGNNVTYDPTNSLAQSVYEDSKVYDHNSNSTVATSIRDFYFEYVEPTLKEIAVDTKRQADKEEQTIVQVGNRIVTDAVVTQQKANGFVFAK